jgi:uncharacterized protein (TIGR04255 family)
VSSALKHTPEPLDLSRKEYDSPPIEEAICEIRFDGDSWDPTFPGRYYSDIEPEYPAKPLQVQHLETTATATGVSFRELPPRTRFSKNDGKSLIHLGQTSLSVNRLRPYHRWESFKAEISTAIGTCAKLLGDVKITRVGIRYTNKIAIPRKPGEAIRLEEYFRCAPQDLSECSKDLGDEDASHLPSGLMGVLSKQIFAWHESGDRMTRTFSHSEELEESLSFLLDFDVYRLSKDAEIGTLGEHSKVEALIEDLRCKQRVAFEASITRECRKLFFSSK